MTSGIVVQRGAGPAAPRSAKLAYVLLVLLVLALQFGPLAGAIGFRLTDDPRWALNGILRDAAVAVLVALGGAAWLTSQRRQPLPPSARWALVTVAVFATFALLSGLSLLLVALNLRRLALMPLLFVALLLIPWTPRQIDRLFGLVVASSVIVALFGLFELAAPESFWTEVLDVDNYSAANQFDRFGKIGFRDGGRFFSGDLEPWTGQVLRRMVSSYLEPTTLAAAMAVLTAAALARRARGHGALLPLLLGVAGGLATISKGYWLFVLLLLSWRLLGAPSPRHLLALSAVTCAVVLAAPTLQPATSGAMVHVAGLTSALQYLSQGNLGGEGIGLAGNYTDAEIDFGEESGLGNAVGQVGLAGLLPLFWVAALARDVFRAAAARRDPGGPWLAAWLVFWTMTYLLSASSLGVGGNTLGFMLLALYLHPASAVRVPR